MRNEAQNGFDLKGLKVQVASLEGGGLERQQRRYNVINSRTHNVTGFMLLTLWMTRDRLVMFACARGGDFYFLFLLEGWQLQSCVCFYCLLTCWPGSRSFHTGRRGRCPGGSEVMAGFLRLEPDPPQWTHSADEPGQTTGGSERQLSRSEGLTHPRTACSLSQQGNKMGSGWIIFSLE